MEEEQQEESLQSDEEEFDIEDREELDRDLDDLLSYVLIQSFDEAEEQNEEE